MEAPTVRTLPLLIALTLIPLAQALVALPTSTCELLGASPIDDCAPWSATFDGNGGSDQLSRIVVSPDGSSVFAAGSVALGSGIGDGTLWYVEARDAEDGSLLWTITHAGDRVSPPINHARALDISPDGATLYVTGVVYNHADGLDWSTLAIDAATGSILWSAGHAGHGEPTTWDEPEDLDLSPDGHTLVVSGWSYGPKRSDGYTTSYDWMTIAYDASTGTELWANRLHLDNNAVDRAHDVEISPDGTFVAVAGRTDSMLESGVRATVAVYDLATGAENWRAHYDRYSTRADEFVALAISPDSSQVFATGESYDNTYRDDYITIAYDATTGARNWVSRYQGTGGGSDSRRAGDAATDIAVSPDGTTVYVTGQSPGDETGANDFVTLALNAADGTRIWLHEGNGPYGATSVDWPWAMAVSHDGATLVVTGSTYDGADIQTSAILTIAIDTASGETSWTAWTEETDEGSGARALDVAIGPNDTQAFIAGFLRQTSLDGYAGALWMDPATSLLGSIPTP